jgi:uncharacterized protein YecT (DUF1311 family)
MRSRVAVVMVITLFAGDPADAAINCKSPANQREMDQCAGRDFDAADAKLNALYRNLMPRYDSGNQAAFKAAEKAWIGYRDAECTFETNGTAGGTINSTMFTQCRKEKTIARIKELNAQLHCEEGDLSCNAPTK